MGESMVGHYPKQSNRSAAPASSSLAAHSRRCAGPAPGSLSPLPRHSPFSFVSVMFATGVTLQQWRYRTFPAVRCTSIASPMP